ncbi:putative bcl-2-like protein 1 isoform X6 [Apostichopus japonicus]|uniref:Putative bcl-2-like protein 1 isoform X6 n=1 Tax=Stichopus japonicus TaxID=307972 RepID=A0A2G8JVK1_STIJA|nr:putative bcl-2-like protein 1 isoform X6 [Apostichopus japonicus]
MDTYTDISRDGDLQPGWERVAMEGMNGLTTRDYMEDYCIYRIRKEVPLPNYDHVRDDPVNAVAARIREIGTQIETKNPDFFAQVCDQLNLNATTAYAQFKDLADELFRDQQNGHQGVSWGRIAALIAFSGRLALHCATHDMENMVPSVIGWTERYLDGNLNIWMQEHDQWDGFMDFFDKDKARERVQDTVSSLVTSVCKYAAFGAGLAAIACLLRR